MRYPGCDFAGPFQRALQAKMSIQYGVAAALQRKAIAEENYQRLADAGILRLISLTSLEEDEAFTQRFPATQGAEVRVSLADGSLVMDRLDDVVPATSDEIRARFRAATAAVLGHARRARSRRASMASRGNPTPGGWRRSVAPGQRRPGRKAVRKSVRGGAGHDRADGRELSAGADRRSARSAPSTA